MTQANGPKFDNSYRRLPDRFFSAQVPTPVKAPALIRINRSLAEQLGVSVAWLESEDGLQVLAGNRLAAGSDPIATVYAGHQFGGWNPRLGDGRAVLLGEVLDAEGRRYDIQLKGAGRTPYARGGDGRSPLGPVLREYIVSEAMAQLGVPTSRSLAAVTTGESVMRERPLPGGILTRVASSHIRIGTFQYFAGQGDLEAIRTLADHVIQRHYPETAGAARPYVALLEAVFDQQAKLIAQWQQLSFIHGVMNTDNMLVSGETIDYGPCAFIDNFQPDTVFSSIDVNGRYAFANQPGIAQWNLAWLARALLPLLDEDQDAAVKAAQQALDGFVRRYEAAYGELMRRKLGLNQHDGESEKLASSFLALMAESEADYTLTFRRLAELAATHPAEPETVGEGGASDSVASLYQLPENFKFWLEQWRDRLERDGRDPAEVSRGMLAINPAFIPRNHLVEEVIRAAVDSDDLEPFHRLVDRLGQPYRYDAADVRLASPPRPEQVVANTFCGT